MSLITERKSRNVSAGRGRATKEIGRLELTGAGGSSVSGPEVGGGIGIPLMKPTLDGDMLEAGLRVLQNEKLVLGESVYKFEEEFARFCGTRYAVSTSSGTAALLIALLSLGIGYGDEVLTSPFSFIATSNAVLHAGGRPTFADSRTSDFNLDPEKAKQRITAKTRALLPVHLFGHPCRMREFVEAAHEKDLKVVEDACQAHGAGYYGKRVGSLGDAGCFSFYPSKNMTVGGDGGMMVTNNEELAEAARSFSDCGRDHRSGKYTMSRVGYTLRLNTFNAAIGRVQLQRLNGWNERRRKIASLYRRELGSVEGVKLPPEGDLDAVPVYHLFVIRSRFRDQIRDRLKRSGVESGIHYPIPIHLQRPYRDAYGFSEGSFPESEQMAREVLSLPMYPDLSEEEVQLICDVVRRESEAQEIREEHEKHSEHASNASSATPVQRE